MSSTLTVPAQTAAERPEKRERRKEARPGELLAAALDLFVEKGFAATRAEEVAQRAGVSKGTLFLYFPSKEELFKAVVREFLSSAISDALEDLPKHQGSSSELVRMTMLRSWEEYGNTKASGITKLMMSEANNFPELAHFYQSEVIVPAYKLLQKVIQRGIDSGEFRPVDVQYATFSMLGPIMFLVMWKHSMKDCCPMGESMNPQRYLLTQAEIVVQGLRNPDFVVFTEQTSASIKNKA
jgi:TetR/AcrR family transcriptional regulator